MNDMSQEIEALFMHFIHIEDATEQLDNFEDAERLKGKRWGWIVHDDASALHAGYRPPFELEYQGIKSTQQEAVDAAVGYIWKCRRDLVDQCRKEAYAGRAYRKQLSEDGNGTAIQ